jgi:hypothetical protein
MQGVEPVWTQQHTRGEPAGLSRDSRTSVWSSPDRRPPFSDYASGSAVTAGFVVEWELPALGNPDDPG